MTSVKKGPYIGVEKMKNRPYSYSRYWTAILTGTSLQLRLMRGVFSNANDISPHGPPLQASSSPIPRIRIWFIDQNLVMK